MDAYQFYTLPMLEFYMSDYMQLGFYIADHRMKHTDGSESLIDGYNHQLSSGINYIMLNLFNVGKRMMNLLMEHAFECKNVTVRLRGKEIGKGNVAKIYPTYGDVVAFDEFLFWFLHCWFHEYLHMIGFTEEQVHFMTRTDVHVIELDGEEDGT